ncbi:UPF1, partial [Symbiodinium sp. KB8]
MFEQFIRAGGDKDQFVRRFMLKKVSESTNELDEEGGYYTPEEMKKLLSYSQTRADQTVAWCNDPANGDDLVLTDLVDKNIKFYWCRTRVKGLKRLRQTQTAEETAEAEGTGPMMLSGMDKNACTPASMGLRTAGDVEALRSEAEKLEIQQKELLSVQEKSANLMDKLKAVSPDKKDRADELRPKLQQMSKTAEALYEQMADALAKISTAQLDPKASEGAKLVLNLTTEGKCSMWTGLERTCRPLPEQLLAGPGDDLFDEGPAMAERPEAEDESYLQLDMFKPSVRDLPRLRELLLQGLGSDARVNKVASILSLGPTVYKIGLTGDPMFRFYKAVLIAEFQGRPGNRNINPGGEGRQVYDPPYFTYIVFKSVPCSKIVGLAKAMRADGLTASGDGFIHELSKVSEKDAEGKSHKLLEKHKLSLPIPVRKIHGDPAIAGFPRLKPLDIFQHMAESGHVNKLLGGRTVQSSHLLLLSFWENYKAIHPDFELFSSHHSDILLEDCIPIVAHIDGGRGYKKSEYMIFDWGAVIGSGSGKKNKKDPAVRAFKSGGNNMQLPLLGHSYTTHYLYAAMPSSWHKNHEDSFQALLRTFAEDLRECFDEGISFKGRVLRLVLIGLKGDLKMQARAGRLTRWFTTARKAPYSEASKVSGQCCWLCSAGDVSTPFEEIHTDNPAWLQKMPMFREPPWEPGSEGGMLKASLGYVERPAKFYLADLFHVYLAGVGQDFCSSCLVYMLPTCFPGSRGNSVDAQIEKLNEVFRKWRLECKEAVHLTAFTRDKLQYFDATSAFPAGTWSKAADTARITKFIVYICELHKDNSGVHGDKILHYIYRAACAISRFMKGLYEADVWIDFELH